MKKSAASRALWIQLGLSAWLLFHVTAIVMGPAPSNYLHGSICKVFQPYWGYLGLGSTWSFYAPDPAPPIFYEWEWEDTAGVRRTGRYPQFPSPYWNYDRQVLRVTALGYIFMQEGAAERSLIPYLCRQLPAVRSVSLWRVAYGVPSTDDFVKGTRKYEIDEQLASREWISHSVCADERSRR